MSMTDYDQAKQEATRVFEIHKKLEKRARRFELSFATCPTNAQLAQLEKMEEAADEAFESYVMAEEIAASIGYVEEEEEEDVKEFDMADPFTWGNF